MSLTVAMWFPNVSLHKCLFHVFAPLILIQFLSHGCVWCSDGSLLYMGIFSALLKHVREKNILGVFVEYGNMISHKLVVAYEHSI